MDIAQYKATLIKAGNLKKSNKATKAKAKAKNIQITINKNDNNGDQTRLFWVLVTRNFTKFQLRAKNIISPV